MAKSYNPFSQKTKVIWSFFTNAINTYLRSQNDPIWITGDGRSGTTWLMEMLNIEGDHRLLFEPFHPDFNQKTNYDGLNHFVPTDCHDSQFFNLAKSIFCGGFFNYKVNSYNVGKFSQKGRIIKDVHSNLLLSYVNERFNKVKKILIIRNPIDVAISKKNKSEWHWMTNPKEFLNNKDLVDKYLYDYVDLINSTSDEFYLKQALIWSIIHYVPFKSLRKSDVHIVLYEDLVRDITVEMKKIYVFLNWNCFPDENKILKFSKKPSRTTDKRFHSQFTPRREHHIPQETLLECYNIVKSFGLDRIYGSTFTRPNRSEAVKLLRDNNP